MVAEDVDEMCAFFRSCGIGRSISKKAALCSVTNGIATTKKLCKIWSKGILSNPTETAEKICRLCDLDMDDYEDVAAALQKLLPSLGLMSSQHALAISNGNAEVSTSARKQLQEEEMKTIEWQHQDQQQQQQQQEVQVSNELTEPDTWIKCYDNDGDLPPLSQPVQLAF